MYFSYIFNKFKKIACDNNNYIVYYLKKIKMTECRKVRYLVNV